MLVSVNHVDVEALVLSSCARTDPPASPKPTPSTVTLVAPVHARFCATTLLTPTSAEKATLQDPPLCPDEIAKHDWPATPDACLQPRALNERHLVPSNTVFTAIARAVPHACNENAPNNVTSVAPVTTTLLR
mmetsp:Transcript_31539/g.73982  ORF Transcript_31539/g.73982 Transcript_31539/m.73982 type:complete len:132 (-) Transcript_31539:31-426(-)